MRKKFYITTAIPYVNAAPHLGFALEIIQADVIARYHRLLGDDVYFLTGSDENALKNVQAAEKEGLTTKQLVDKYSQQFKDLKKILNLSFDDFIRTSEKKHFLGSQKLWKACLKDIYKKNYKGYYCVGCEEFKTEKDLVKGKCPEHPDKKLELVEEENYFFKLSRYQKELESLIDSDKLKIIPKEKKKEILSFIKSGLKDFSVSRSYERAKGWGIEVPGDSSQIIYVWFDALINYMTALNYHKNGELFKKYWPADLHVIGKGIIRFHAVYWPAMLLSAGLPIPKQELVHGYITIEGQKISKSLGNVISPNWLVKKYGTEAVRYYLLRVAPIENDLDFSIAHFREVYNADLANGIGNLVQRVSKLCEKRNYSPKYPLWKEVPDQLENHGYKVHMERYEFNLALEVIWRIIKITDSMINNEEPWRSSEEKAERTLVDAVFNIADIEYGLRPFLPETAEKIEKIFTADKIVAPKKPLFPRLQ